VVREDTNNGGKAGTTLLINYGKLLIRMLFGAALVLAADTARFPMYFLVPGWFTVASSVVLCLVPMRLHHAYSVQAADRLKPIYLRHLLWVLAC